MAGPVALAPPETAATSGLLNLPTHPTHTYAVPRVPTWCPHVLLHSMRVKSLQLYPTLCSPMGCSPPGPSVHGILQARRLKWVSMPSSRGSSWLWDGTRVSCIAGRFFTVWATREAQTLSLIPSNDLPRTKMYWNTQSWFSYNFQTSSKRHEPNSRMNSQLSTLSHVALFTASAFL